jgi:ATP-binding cassette, subfamily F, member 3
MLTIHNLSFHFGGRTLYDEANLQIRPKDKIGLVGPNGVGKSTLLRLIVGEYQLDGGSISKSSDCTIGFLNQDLLSYQTEDSILEVAMQAFERQNFLQTKIDETLHNLEHNYSDELIDELGAYQTEFEQLDGYSVKAKTEEILEGLGFRTEDLDRPLHQFSGGWRMRVMLAKLLLQKPSLLLLDEPTNHLDLPSIEWIENYLQSYEGAVVVVSHDRDFLNNTSKTIVEVNGGKLNVYTGNYDDYLDQREERMEIQRNAYENQQDKIRQMERFIDRFRAKASKAKLVQSKVKALNRLETVDEVSDDNVAMNFKFNFSQPSGKQVIALEAVSKAYDTLRILEKTTIFLERGDKIALVGANGKGKSTLLRILAGKEVFEGKRSEGHNVRTTFYAQHQLEALNVNNDILGELQQEGTKHTENDLRGILGCFLFSGEDAYKRIKVLSGGEKARVALSKTLISESNFLLLDEPTNHLDMLSVNILIQALQRYEGTFITVSHDRHFVRNVANKIWYIENQEIKEYLGGFDEYENWQKERILAHKAVPETFIVKKTPIIEQKKEEKTNVSSQNIKKIQKEIEQTEIEISKLEENIKSFENTLAQPEIFENPQKLKDITQQYEHSKKNLQVQNTNWEKLIERLDRISS